jgi:deoxyribodipyrimidine photolyase-related protein
VNHLVVLGDQLTDQVGPLRALLDGKAAFAEPILVVEVTGVRHEARHVQAVVLQLAALRGFAAELRDRGLHTEVVQAPTLGEALTAAQARCKPTGITVMDPSHPQDLAALQAWSTANGVPVDVVENQLWLTSVAEWEAFKVGRKELRMEYWYRRVRSVRGWLMEERAGKSEPIGGTWNLDSENRKRLAPGVNVPAPFYGTVTPLVQSVIDEVLEDRTSLFGELDAFIWPTTRREALAALDAFCDERLANFGPFEDAMSKEHEHLFHSLLSPALNLGLLTPVEVCERALQTYAARTNDIPLSSIEGFIRQILGWREFMRHAYREYWREWQTDNGLDAHEDLPALYWSGETKMACMSRIVNTVLRTGHVHHIERLMVLGNFALLFGVQPQQVDAWFLEAFVDALPWVVTPNVVAMSQFADLGRITSKPYICGGAYISRMGDDCASCFYTPTESVGETACPFTTLYWEFIDRHSERFAKNPRMATQVRSWLGRPESTRTEILVRAADVRSRAELGEL